MSILEREIALYESHRSEFEKDHESEWVVISGDEIAGFFPDFQEAAATAVSRFGRGPYLIRQIGAPEAAIPLSLSTRPMYV